MILHAIDISAADPFRKLKVSYLILLLVHYQAMIPPDTYFKTGSGDKTRLISVLNAKKA